MQSPGLTGSLGKQMEGEALMVAGSAGGSDYRRWNTNQDRQSQAEGALHSAHSGSWVDLQRLPELPWPYSLRSPPLWGQSCLSANTCPEARSLAAGPALCQRLHMPDI